MENITLVSRKTKAEAKKTLGNYPITFRFGDSEEGEEMMLAFKAVYAKIGGTPKVFDLIIAEYKRITGK